MATRQFDYVVVGAGSSGCVLANRLSADPGTSVLLLEAGGTDAHPCIAIPKGVAFILGKPDYAWYYRTEPFGPYGQSETWLRGKVVGGSSSVNGMVYNRGSRADFDGVEAQGNPGWGWDQMLRVYRAMENHSLGSSGLRGSGGPLSVSVRTDTEAVDELLIESAARLGMERTLDLNSSDEERIGYAPATIHRRRRMSAARAFLRPVRKRPQLTLRTGVQVTRVLFEGDRACGVEALVDGSRVTVSARREVILSSGSIATPQLLELSGIGAPDVLKDAGVDVRVASPRVGEGVREHRCVPLQVRLAKNIGYNRLLSSRAGQGLSGARWMLTGRGPVGTPAYDMLAFTKTRPELDRPDAQFLLTPYTMGVAAGGYGVENRPGFSLLGFTLRPTSEGSVHIRSADVRKPPRIVPNYFSTAYDRDTSVALFRRMRALVEQSPIADLVSTEIIPGRMVEDDEEILRAGFFHGGTGYHASGSVGMGPTDEYPVDPRLRVRGVEGLRVVDVSVFPAMVSGNLNAPAMAAAWRAAEYIREDNS
ncbi:GMC family oxidoreductase N-terminal domain-containing protein [Streptomyces sp. NPDC048106]|uniref:GMC family oxidoreductase n=1 Tax=Streptomyces sp. NPDC048106 TaxID=3155750 RepID=UPI0034541D04